MSRLFEPAAYGPQGACFWADTVTAPDWPRLDGACRAEVAVIGGGFTGLNAAITLASAGASVIVLEAEHPGWGASGRNGGFCCLGGSKASDATLESRHGAGAAQAWAETEVAAVRHVTGLIDAHGWEVDRHSRGETLLAHTPRKFAALRARAKATEAELGVKVDLHGKDDLAALGLGGPWHGAMTVPVGFALNPRKYHSGLARAAAGAGAALCAHSPVTALSRHGDGWQLTTPGGTVTAGRVILATNGYSHEDLPPWMRARTLPAQSSVIVTRPLSEDEQREAGWWSAQMAYDTRFLLHYFRLLPDGRFLFGTRGGVSASPAALAGSARRARRDFERMFPAWATVETPYCWSGLVCLTATLTPFVGPVDDSGRVFAAFGYHGNGLALSRKAGRAVADLATGHAAADALPAPMRGPLRRFPLAPARRLGLRAAYAAYGLHDLLN